MRIRYKLDFWPEINLISEADNLEAIIETSDEVDMNGNDCNINIFIKKIISINISCYNNK